MRGEITKTYSFEQERDPELDRVERRIDTNVERIETMMLSVGFCTLVVFIDLLVTLYLIFRG